MTNGGPGILARVLRTAARPSHWAPVLRSVWPLDGRTSEPDRRHLLEAVGWLVRAHDATDGRGGVSGGYYPSRGGWLASYPETTGYIIPTLLDVADVLGDPSLEDRAGSMSRWEIDIQLASGAVRGGVGYNSYPIVFNTGQVIQGWAAWHRRTGDRAALDAAVRAGRWLVGIQAADGSWTQHTHKGVPHAYSARVAWPLLELHALTGEPAFREAGARHIAWVLSQREADGWIRLMGFTPDESPLTHTIAYTLRGLWESGLLLGDALGDEACAAATVGAERLLTLFERRKAAPDQAPRPMPGRLSSGWKPAARFSCVTGNCQISLNWLRITAQRDDPRLLNGALKLLDQVKGTQSLRSANPGIRGGIPGSWPVWGEYNPFAYPNWACKFFVDALLEQERALARVTARLRTEHP